jgi:hypothetical protein
MRKKKQKELDKINALRLRLRLNGILSDRYAPHGIRLRPRCIATSPISDILRWLITHFEHLTLFFVRTFFTSPQGGEVILFLGKYK